MQPADLVFIRSSWISAARHQQEWLSKQRVPVPAPEVWRAGMERRVDRLLSRSHVLVMESAGTGQVVGYVVHDSSQQAIHMLLVKQPYRQWGAARALYKAAVPSGEAMKYSQRTGKGAALARKWGMTYDPFTLEET